MIDSILSANEKSKIKISKIEDNTAELVEILIHLPSTVAADDIMPALYAFTDCEVSLAPNACVIQNNHPQFLSVNDIIKSAAFLTRDLLQQELEIKLGELQENGILPHWKKYLSKKNLSEILKKKKHGKGSLLQ